MAMCMSIAHTSSCTMAMCMTRSGHQHLTVLPCCRQQQAQVHFPPRLRRSQAAPWLWIRPRDRWLEGGLFHRHPAQLLHLYRGKTRGDNQPSPPLFSKPQPPRRSLQGFTPAPPSCISAGCGNRCCRGWFWSHTKPPRTLMQGSTAVPCLCLNWLRNQAL